MTDLFVPLFATLSLAAGTADAPAALVPASLASLPAGHDQALGRTLANRPPYRPEEPHPTFKATAAWEWRPTAGPPLLVSRACTPTGECLVAVVRAEGSEVTVLFSSPQEWWPLSDAASLSTDAATKDLIVSDRLIGRKRAAFVRAGKGMVMDVSSDASRWRTDREAVPSLKPALDVAVPTLVAVLDAWREKQVEALVTRATYPFVASLAVRERKRVCHPKPRAITARNAEDFRRQTSVLFGHPFRREPVLGRALDPQCASWRAYEPHELPKQSSNGQAGRDVAYVQVELFDLPRGVDSMITVEVLPNGSVRRLSYEDFAWAERIEQQCNDD